MDTGLAGQTVVILGAAGGIGRALATAFATEGCHLRLLDTNPSVLGQADELSQQFPIQAHAVSADAADWDTVQSFSERCAATGDVDHVIVAVGVGSGQFGMPFWKVDIARWMEVVAANLMACVHAAHAFAPAMVTRRRGSFCFLSSVAGQIGSPTDPPYSAAKAAVINFMQCAARDLAPFQIRANAISPGMVRTGLNRSVWQAWCQDLSPEERLDYDAWAERKLAQVTPLRRWQTVEEVAAAGVFLASRWGENVTGQTLNVDGGQVMHA